ncbi:MAG: hypothetical protein Fur0041_16890 [Bacteroidia bacterium]
MLSAQQSFRLADDALREKEFILLNSASHTAVKPFPTDLFNGADRLDREKDSTVLPYQSPRNAWAVLYSKDQSKREKAEQAKTAFVVKPVYQALAGIGGFEDNGIRILAGGITTQFDYRKKISAELNLAAGQAVLPAYLDSFARKHGVMPGWGDRAYARDSNTVAWQHLSGELTWKPNKVFYLQAGRGKHFWGEGYRSMFLSDIGAAYPYLKQSTTIWKLQYTSLFAWLQDWTASAGSAKDFRNKFATFHYISWNATKWLNIGVFESVIWQGSDKNRYRGFDPNYLNPMVFYRPVEYSLGSSDNALLGLSGKIRINRNNFLYGQLLLDEFYLKEIRARRGWWANKYAIQGGFKTFNLVEVKNLNMMFEVNVVRPFTYAHGSTQQNYSHAGMPLAHPAGSNFAEFISMLSWSTDQFYTHGKLMIVRAGRDTAGVNLGNNINLSYINRYQEYNNSMFQGMANTILYTELKAGWQINKQLPLRFEITSAIRWEKSKAWSKKTAYVMGGISMPLWRSYFDF